MITKKYSTKSVKFMNPVGGGGGEGEIWKEDIMNIFF